MDDLEKEQWIKLYDLIIEHGGLEKKLSARTYDALSELVDDDFPEQSKGYSGLIHCVRQYLHNSINTDHKYFSNNLWRSSRVPSLFAEIISSLTNTSMSNYEIAPFATVLELKIIKVVNKYIGFENGGGIFTSGGSQSNLVSTILARDNVYPNARNNGMQKGGRLTAFVSRDAHYSVSNAANVIGIGTKNLISIDVDDNGAMLPVSLQQAINTCIETGGIPFLVVATLGTSVRGAFDPIQSIYDITKKHSIWLHCDAAFGGFGLFSSDYCHYFTGIEFADSVAWDAHKVMGIGLTCSILFVKNSSDLSDSFFNQSSGYIFHDNNELDQGRSSLQCARRVDVLKIWFSLNYYGMKSYRKQFSIMHENSLQFENMISESPYLQMAYKRQSFTLCFSAKGISSIDSHNEIHLNVRQKLIEENIAMINYYFKDGRFFFRYVMLNSELSFIDIQGLIKKIEILFVERLKLELHNFERCASETSLL